MLSAARSLARAELAGRPWRTALMIGAVALASSLIAALACAIASVEATTEYNITRFLGAADARIIHPANGRFDGSLLDTVDAWPEVEAATLRLRGSLALVRADGGVDPETGRPRRVTATATGHDFARERDFRVFELESGRLPEAPDEVVLDPLSADKLDVAPGERVAIQRFGDPIELEVAGVLRRPKIGALQRPRVLLDREVLAEASGRPGTATSLWIVLPEGTDVDAFSARRDGDVPDVLVVEPAERARSGFDRQMRGTRIALPVGAMVTFLGAGFIIVTGLTTGVGERQRELALFRALGASRGQVFRGQLLAGLGVGAGGGLIGVPLGIGLAAVLAWLYREILPAGLRVDVFGTALSATGAITSGAVGGLYPAWHASRAAPLEAMAVRARPPRRGAIVLVLAAALACGLAHVPIMAIDDPERRFWTWVWVGLPTLLVGGFLLGVPVARLLGAGLSRPVAAVLRLPPDMLRQTFTATPFRHGLTAGALMVGMALLVSTWANGIALRRDWLERIRFADAFAFSPVGIPGEHVEAIGDLPFVEAICPVGQVQVQLVGDRMFGLEGLSPRNLVLVGFDAEVFFSMNRLEWIEGDEADAIPALHAGRGAIVAERFLVAKGLGVGDEITLGLAGRERTFDIVGVVSSAGLDVATQMFGTQSAYAEYAVSSVFVDGAVLRETFDADEINLVQVNLADDVDDEAAREEVLAAAPGAIFFSGRFVRELIDDVSAAALAVQSTIAVGGMVIASLAVGNVIAAGIQARRFEYGVMRSIGAGRGTVRASLLAESALLAVAGGLVGTGVGLRLAAIDATNLRDLAGLAVVPAVPLLPAFLGGLLLVGLALAAAWPAVHRLLRRPPAGMLGED